MAAVRAWRWVGTTSGPAPALVDVGLACCTLEFEATLLALTRCVTGMTLEPTTVERLPPGTPQLVVVSGTVTDRLAPAVLAVIDLCRAVGPVRTVAFGACAISGGPYWDSYAVTNGLDQWVEVAEAVAGCPPTPDALLAVIDDFLGSPESAELAAGSR